MQLFICECQKILTACKMKVQLESSKTTQVECFRSEKLQKVQNNHKKELEKAEIREYLMKLQEIVPFLPKNKRLSNLEVISNVIDYIHDLRETLGLPACSAIFDTEVAATPTPASTSNMESNIAGFSSPSDPLITPTLPPQSKHQHRKPLCVISNPAR